jgi:hypothetical protein
MYNLKVPRASRLMMAARVTIFATASNFSAHATVLDLLQRGLPQFGATSKLEFWRGETYQAFFENLDLKGGFYYEVREHIARMLEDL